MCFVVTFVRKICGLSSANDKIPEKPDFAYEFHIIVDNELDRSYLKRKKKPARIMQSACEVLRRR